MIKLSQLRVDTTAATKGVWFPYEGGCRLKIAKAGNREYTAFMRERMRDLEVRAEPEQHDDIHTEAIARHLLKDWDGVLDRDGKPIPYTYLKGIEMLSDEGYADLKADVIAFATRAWAFREEQTRAALGNSGGSSNGASPPTESPLPAPESVAQGAS